jgi:MoaA/NifB/PqqE/SkfB family radical SAM enzyme
MRAPRFLGFQRRRPPASSLSPVEEGAELDVFSDVRPVDGFYSLERDALGAFCWARRRFTLRFPADSRFWSACLCYPVEGERLVARDRRGTQVVLALHEGWHTYAIDLSALEGDAVDFEVSRVVPCASDPRELGVRIRRLSRLRHSDDCARRERMLENRLLNERELESGAVVLTSLPPLIRIAVETRCNIKPRCVYCDWEKAKLDEAESDFRFSFAALAELGAFYRAAEGIAELGYGEPPMSPEFSSLVEEFSDAGKAFAFACNGQILGPAVRQPLLGKDIQVLVSIDAATAESYARYRNGYFDLVLENLTALCAEKKAHRNLPVVTATFIAMRSNVGEFEAFLELMQRAGVDTVRVMGLDGYSRLLQRAEQRGGARYDYAEERLSFEELEHFVDRAKGSARRRSIPLYAVTDFGLEHHGNGRPLCEEPWRTMNVLNRGIIACCNNKVDRLAEWSERGDRSLEQFLGDVWNAPAYQEMRATLAQGKLPEICRNAGSCSIVARHQRAELERSSAPAAPPAPRRSGSPLHVLQPCVESAFAGAVGADGRRD